METKIITYKDFKEIAKDNEYFLWHFLQRDQEKNNFTFYSISKTKDDYSNQLYEILPFLNIPYYESYVDENTDFLINVGVNRKIWEAPVPGSNADPKFLFKPTILLFKGYSFKGSTYETCYCVEGIIDLLGKENPELLSGF